MGSAVAQKKKIKRDAQEKKQRAGKKKYGENKGVEEPKKYWPCKLPPWGQFHPIHEIPERDFMDGALVGAGSLKPTVWHTPC